MLSGSSFRQSQMLLDIDARGSAEVSDHETRLPYSRGSEPRLSRTRER